MATNLHFRDPIPSMDWEADGGNHRESRQADPRLLEDANLRAEPQSRPSGGVGPDQEGRGATARLNPLSAYFLGLPYVAKIAVVYVSWVAVGAIAVAVVARLVAP